MKPLAGARLVLTTEGRRVLACARWFLTIEERRVLAVGRVDGMNSILTRWPEPTALTQGWLSVEWME